MEETVQKVVKGYVLNKTSVSLGVGPRSIKVRKGTINKTYRTGGMVYVAETRKS